MKSVLTICITILLACPGIGQLNNISNLMPIPQKVERTNERLSLNESFRIAVHGNPDKRLYQEASRFVRRVSDKTGIFLDKQGFVVPTDTNSNAALLIRVKRPGKLELNEDESYKLEITGRQALITAET